MGYNILSETGVKMQGFSARWPKNLAFLIGLKIAELIPWDDLEDDYEKYYS